MIKVFLVEDEIIMRNGIKNNIPWEKEGYEFVGEASDGELAYPLIKKTQPDILITDIRMPFMDGLELSSLVKKEFPKTKIIILSGYNDFTYAKEAIHIGVTDYLLKPVNAKTLLEAISKVAEQIRKEREEEAVLDKYRQEMEENAVLEKQRLFNDILTNRIGFREALERGEILGMELVSSYYQIMLFKLMPMGNPMNYSEQGVACQQELEEMLRQKEHLMTFGRGADGWTFLLLGETQEELEDTAQELESDLKTIVLKYRDMGWFGGMGSVVGRLNELQNSYREANQAFAGRFFTESNQVLCYENLDMIFTGKSEKLDMESIDLSKISQSTIASFLKSGGKEEIQEFVEEYLKSMGEQNYHSLLFRQYIIMNCYFIVSSFLKGIGLEPGQLSGKVTDVDEVIKDTNSMSHIKYYLENLFTEAMSLRDAQSECRYSRVLEEAREYILQNYANDEISLNNVAAKVNISPSYFSSIFSQETGCTFIEFLTKTRIEKAKELLMCTNSKATEIAYEVGYKDSHYFGYLFKKNAGCTPKEFRARNREA